MNNGLPIASPKAALRTTLSLLTAYRWQFAGVIALQTVAVIATLISPQLIGQLVSRVSAGDATRRFVDLVALTIVGTTVLGAILNRYAMFHARSLGEAVFARMRERFIDKIVRLPLSAVENAGTGDLVGRTTNDVSNLEFLLRIGVPQILVCIVRIVFILVMALVTSPILGVALLVVAPPVYFIQKWYLPRAIPTIRARSAATARINGHITATAENAETIDALGLGRRRILQTEATIRENFELERLTAWLRARLVFQLNLAWNIPIVLVLLWGAWLAGHGLVGIGAITTVVLYSEAIRHPVAQLNFWIEEVQSTLVSLQRIMGVDDVPSDREVGDASPDGSDMHLEDVRFEYRSGIEVLHGVSLDIKPGERLVLVGPSGSGKSTLGRLLAGIHPPTSGSVTVGGVELTTLPEEELRRQVALVTQEQHVFAGSVADNVRLAHPEASDETVRAALREMGAWSWVSELPEQELTMVGAGHVELTPVQAQEIALARLVLLGPHTLILDEATSLLDPHSARALEHTLSTALEGRTVIEIAHRLYTARDADRVAVVLDGQIVELGSHDELVALGGEYARLWEAWSQS